MEAAFCVDKITYLEVVTENIENLDSSVTTLFYIKNLKLHFMFCSTKFQFIKLQLIFEYG
jgi:hypothetical protein